MIRKVFSRWFSGAGRYTGHGAKDIESLKAQIDPARLPLHVGIIMDGNGRWALRQGLPRLSGHAAGSEKAEDIVKFAQDIGIRHVTLYVFSTENWGRPKKEVEGLMNLLVEMFEEGLQDLVDYGTNIKVIGRRDRLRRDVLRAIIVVEDRTAQTPNVCESCRRLWWQRRDSKSSSAACEEGCLQEIDPETICEEHVSSHLYTASVPEPDLIIRAGEMRISNFLIWQSAYAEMVVTPVLWPDFSGEDLLLAILEYQSRDRRFGSV